nr:hypothetical protein [Candidatus Sigynarchaeota archaeon]
MATTDNKFTLLMTYDNTENWMSVEQLETMFQAKDHLFVNYQNPRKTQVFFAVEKRCNGFDSFYGILEH